MCVSVAIKLPRDPETGLPTANAKWRLAKVRDRAYSPEYSVKRWSVKDSGASQLFLIDEASDWTEGVSVSEDGSYLSMVNSALNNSMDKKDGKAKSKGPTGEDQSANGRIVRKALKTHDVKKCADVLIENKIDGATLITDGDRLYVIETTLPLAVKNKYRAERKRKDVRFEDIVPLEEYQTVTREIKGDNNYLVVRTNIGVLNSNFGYQKKDGENYISSVKRRKYTIDALKKHAFEPIDLMTTLCKLGNKDIDKNPYYRPLRSVDHVDDYITPIYSTAVIQTDPSGTIIVKPLECEFNIKDTMNLVDDKYLTHMVILPKMSRMFESFKQFNKIYSHRDVAEILE